MKTAVAVVLAGASAPAAVLVAGGRVLAAAAVSAALLAGGPTPAAEKAQAAEMAQPAVQVHGSLRAIMHGGETGAAVRLADLLPDETLFALGALSGLRGEVTIVGGQAWLAYPEGQDGLRHVMGTTSEEEAALLVASRVTGWAEARLEEAAAAADLDQRLEDLAAAAGLPTGAPFAFLVEGALADLHWHVIDGTRLAPGAGGHAAHRDAAVTGEAASAEGTLIGFYSRSHQGVFTHMGSRIHMHVVLSDGSVSGHVDAVTLPAGTVVRLAEPAAR